MRELSVGLVLAGRNDDGSVCLTDTLGFPITFSEVTELAELCQEVLSSKTAEDLDLDHDEFYKATYPGMYYQSHDDETPLQERYKHTTPKVREAKPKIAKPGYVYLAVAEGTGRWKIGRTQKLRERGNTLQKQCPFPLIIEHVIWSDDHEAMESSLHDKHKDCRVYGEWFELTPAQVEEIKSI